MQDILLPFLSMVSALALYKVENLVRNSNFITSSDSHFDFVFTRAQFMMAAEIELFAQTKYTFRLVVVDDPFDARVKSETSHVK